jgi:hypothetical protein
MLTTVPLCWPCENTYKEYIRTGTETLFHQSAQNFEPFLNFDLTKHEFRKLNVSRKTRHSIRLTVHNFVTKKYPTKIPATYIHNSEMLHDPSSCTSMPLIVTAPLSASCGMDDRLIIQRPPCESASFDWSDFPIIQHDSFFPSPMATEYQNTSDSGMEDALSTASSDSDLLMASTKPSNSRRVQFSTTLEVRTHSIVLGDHPLCSALPVELGWEYDDADCIDLGLYELNKFYYGGVRRRSYMERKYLLQEFIGEHELQLEAQLNLRKAAPSSRQLVQMA